MHGSVSDMSTLIKFMDRKEKLLITASVLLVILQVRLEVQVPDQMKVMSRLLQEQESDRSGLINSGMTMIACAVLALMVSVGVGYIIARVATELEIRLRDAAFTRVMDYSLEEVAGIGSASLISRCTSDIQVVGEFINHSYQQAIKAPITVLIVLYKIIGADYRWILADVAAAALISLLLYGVFSRILPMVPLQQKQRDIMTQYSREHINGMRVIHAYDGFGHQHERMLGQADRVLDLDLFYYQRYALVHPGATAILNGLSLAIYAMGASIITASAPEARAGLYADMLAYLSLGTLLVSSFIYMASVLTNFPRARVSINRVMEVIDKDISITDGKGAVPLDEDAPAVEFSHVSFRYPGGKGMALTDISFRVNKGETLALIGATGCGKTSVLNLIPRLFDATEGEVYVNGVNVKDYKLNELRNILGYVPQKSYLFTRTIARNIGYGNNGRFRATLEHIREAARVGQADEFIRMKEGEYESEVAAGGSNFSGGQKQRLTISRAIARDPSIYLFDDSFSALDFKTDRVLRKELRETAADATMIVVAQRISTIRGADRIIVLDEGRIVGEGTHDELMKECEVYREIAASQNAED
jgi:ATP-binding cassette subfamily B protein